MDNNHSTLRVDPEGKSDYIENVYKDFSHISPHLQFIQPKQDPHRFC